MMRPTCKNMLCTTKCMPLMRKILDTKKDYCHVCIQACVVKALSPNPRCKPLPGCKPDCKFVRPVLVKQSADDDDEIVCASCYPTCPHCGETAYELTIDLDSDCKAPICWECIATDEECCCP